MKRNLILVAISLLVGAGLAWYFIPTKQVVKIEKQVQEVVKERIVKSDGTVITRDIVRKTEEKTSIPKVKNWLVTASSDKNNHSLTVSRRILGDFFVGIQADNRGYVGVALSISF